MRKNKENFHETEKQTLQKTKMRFILFVFIVSFIVASLSVVSDNLPYTEGKIGLWQFVYSYIAIMVNSLPFWFILAMVVGYKYGNSYRGAALKGMIYTLVAITLYFIFGSLYAKIATLDVPNLTSWTDRLKVFTFWYGTSIVGGIVGGLTGYGCKKTSYAWIPLIGGLLLQLVINGKRSWEDSVGVGQNLTYFVILIVACMMFITKKRESCNQQK